MINNNGFMNSIPFQPNFLAMSKGPSSSPRLHNNESQEHFSDFAQVLEEATSGEEEKIRQYLSSRKF